MSFGSPVSTWLKLSYSDIQHAQKQAELQRFQKQKEKIAAEERARVAVEEQKQRHMLLLQVAKTTNELNEIFWFTLSNLVKINYLFIYCTCFCHERRRFRIFFTMLRKNALKKYDKWMRNLRLKNQHLLFQPHLYPIRMYQYWQYHLYLSRLEILIRFAILTVFNLSDFRAQLPPLLYLLLARIYLYFNL